MTNPESVDMKKSGITETGDRALTRITHPTINGVLCSENSDRFLGVDKLTQMCGICDNIIHCLSISVEKNPNDDDESVLAIMYATRGRLEDIRTHVVYSSRVLGSLMDDLIDICDRGYITESEFDKLTGGPD